jgi:hypothetical protein
MLIENLFLAGTYEKILARISKAALESAELHLNTTVTAVTSIHCKNDRMRVKVETNNDTFDFDEVIITVPLGCLKRATVEFSPPLPSRLLRAITNASYGRLEKVYITFPTAFWEPSSPDATGFPFASHFLAPKYHPGGLCGWNVEAASLSSVRPRDAGHPTLLFYIYGPCGTYITNLITDLAPSSPEYTSRLLAFFQPYYSRLPNYAATLPECVPSAVLATDWQHDPLAGYGSYSNFQISAPVGEGGEEVRLDEDIEVMRAGMPEQGIWFAGEHTAPFIALGTVVGAWLSGLEVGRRIASAYGLGPEPAES